MLNQRQSQVKNLYKGTHYQKILHVSQVLGRIIRKK
jgi:hypothetical protein